MQRGPAPILPIAPGDVVGGRYRVARLIGAGAMGAVFEVVTDDGRSLALKLLTRSGPPAAGREQVARFVREIQISSSINSPHIVPVIDGGLDEATRLPFLVMQLLVGEDLATCVRRLGPLHPTLAARIISQASLGLRTAHAAGVVHRDIKPGNIYLCHGAAGEVTVRVCDFGVAKPSADPRTITATGCLLGTPLYMAPEQVDDAKRVSPSVDIWSVGMTLYECLAGAPALGRLKNLSDLVIALAHGEVPHLQDRAPWVDPDLAALVHGCLILSPDARCPSMEALRSTLARFTVGTDNLQLAALQPLGKEWTDRRAPRAQLPMSWSAAAPSFRPPPPDADTSGSLVGARLAGRYDITRELGSGGKGVVYEGVSSTGKPVAIKVLRANDDAAQGDQLDRFVREARTAASIASPHVVRVLELGTEPNLRVPFIVMERLAGSDLQAFLARHGPLDPAVAAEVFVQACRGVKAAHVAGVVHRNIKPSNLFLHEQSDGQVVVKVCDFGTAKITELGDNERTVRALTSQGALVGSPTYLSPEQAQDPRTVDHRADIWGLAITMYQTLTGRRPWGDAESLVQVVFAICTRDLEPLGQVAPSVPPALAEAVHRALRRKREDRTSTVDELEAALEPFARAARPLRKEALSGRPAAPGPVAGAARTPVSIPTAAKRPADVQLVVVIAVAVVLVVIAIAAIAFAVLASR